MPGPTAIPDPVPLDLVPHDLVPLHLGALHPVEQLLTLLLAFGPFVLLAITIRVSRRRNARDDDPDAPGRDETTD